MKIKLLILFITIILFASCVPNHPLDTCSEYGCGDNGKCVTSKNGDKNCKCYEDFYPYSFYENDIYAELEYCVAQPKQIIFPDKPIIVLSNEGRKPPIPIKSDNLMVFPDLYKACSGNSYISEERNLFVKDIILTYNFEMHYYLLGSYKRIIFDEKIKDNFFIFDNDFYSFPAFLFDDGSIKYYPKGYSYNGINFKSENYKIIKAKGNFYITDTGELFHYDLNTDFFYLREDNVLVYNSLDDIMHIDKVETIDLPINIDTTYNDIDYYHDFISKCENEFDDPNDQLRCIRKFQKAYVLFDNNTVKSYYKNENNEYIEEEPFRDILNNDEKILYLRDACIFTNQRNFYCNDNNNEVRTIHLDDGIEIENEDFFTFNGKKRLCYLNKNNKKLYNCYMIYPINEK
jgi:hypothetical protein